MPVWVIKTEFVSCCRGKASGIFESGSEINDGSLPVIGCFGQSRIFDREADLSGACGNHVA